MSCHVSSPENSRICNGYLAREGWSNINVRLLPLEGQIASPFAALDACEAAGIERQENCSEVLRKQEGTLPCRRLRLPRGPVSDSEVGEA
jgi:hypothetical protein